MSQFHFFCLQGLAYGYDQLLDGADLKNLNIWTLRATLLLAAYSWPSMALDLAQMVLDVRKNFKPTQFYMLNNLC